MAATSASGRLPVKVSGYAYADSRPEADFRCCGMAGGIRLLTTIEGIKAGINFVYESWRRSNPNSAAVTYIKNIRQGYGNQRRLD